MSERGSIAIAGLAGALVFATAALAVADLGAMLDARARAQAAADAAALAAVADQIPILSRGDPRDAAEELASRNGASVVRCGCEPGSPIAVVEVEVASGARWVPGWRGARVRAEAVAEADADLLTYRDAG